MGSVQSGGEGWWQASDGLWYSPEQAPGAGLPDPPQKPAPLQAFTPAAVPVPPTTPSSPPAPRVQTTVAVASSAGGRPGVVSSATSVVGNILWLALAGVWLAIAYVIAGLLNMITIIGIPFGIQSFKLAGYALWPFGRVVVTRPNADAGLSTLGNVIWFIFGGFFLALLHLFVGLLLCLTVVGIPLGLASIKMAGLAIAPFGKQVVSRSKLATMPGVVVVTQIS